MPYCAVASAGTHEGMIPEGVHDSAAAWARDVSVLDGQPATSLEGDSEKLPISFPGSALVFREGRKPGPNPSALTKAMCAQKNRSLEFSARSLRRIAASNCPDSWRCFCGGSWAEMASDSGMMALKLLTEVARPESPDAS